MSGALQAVYQNQRSFGIPEPAIGSAFGGGYYGGAISTAGNSVADYYLVVGPLSVAQATSQQWKTTGTATTGTQSPIDGPSNSSTMNNASHPAAQFCEAVNTGGFTDWYMPAINELDVCYYNLKPDTTVNSTASGINANSVPARASNNTTSIPAQTSATAFRVGGAEPFTEVTYWSSTSSLTLQPALRAQWQYFDSGYHNVPQKTYTSHVRAIRRVAV